MIHKLSLDRQGRLQQHLIPKCRIIFEMEPYLQCISSGKYISRTTVFEKFQKHLFGSDTQRIDLVIIPAAIQNQSRINTRSEAESGKLYCRKFEAAGADDYIGKFRR
jgi:hypothetical protein